MIARLCNHAWQNCYNFIFSTIPICSHVKLTVVCLRSGHVRQLVNSVCQNLSNHLLDVALGMKSQLVYKD